MKRRIKIKNADDYKLQNPLAMMGEERGLDRTGLAYQLEISVERMNKYIYPLDHPNFRVPPASVLERIFLWSGGVLVPNSFHAVLDWQAELVREEQSS